MRAYAGPEYPGVDHRLFGAADVYPRAVFAHGSYSPIGIATGVNWASHFGYLVRD